VKKRSFWFLAALAIGVSAVTGDAAHAADDDAFTLSAQVGGLFPGAHLLLPVTVHNPQPDALIVARATVTAGDASALCTGNYLTADPLTEPVPIAARGTRTVMLAMRMSAAAPDACQGAIFPLTLVAAGEIVDRGGAAAPLAFTGLGDGTRSLAVAGVAAIVVGLLLLSRRRATECESA
jgi:hypothetical protein